MWNNCSSCLVTLIGELEFMLSLFTIETKSWCGITWACLRLMHSIITSSCEVLCIGLPKYHWSLGLEKSHVSTSLHKTWWSAHHYWGAPVQVVKIKKTTLYLASWVCLPLLFWIQVFWPIPACSSPAQLLPYCSAAGCCSSFVCLTADDGELGRIDVQSLAFCLSSQLVWPQAGQTLDSF